MTNISFIVPSIAASAYTLRVDNGDGEATSSFTVIAPTTTTTTAAPTTTTTTTLAPNVTLTISYASGAWSASVTAPIPTALNFTNCMVSGYRTSSTCTGGADDSDSINGFTLPANTSFASRTTNGLSCSDTKFKMSSNVTINGTAHATGTAFTIGSQTIHVIINKTTCATYPC